MEKRALFASASSISPATYAVNENVPSELESLALSSKTLDAILKVQESRPPTRLDIKISDSSSSDSENEERAENVEGKSHVKRKIDGTSSDENVRKKRKKEKRKKDKKTRKHKKRTHKENRKSPESTKLVDYYKLGQGKCFLDEFSNLKPEEAIAADKKGNESLLKYESVSKLQIPKYKLATYNCVGNSVISVSKGSSEKTTKNKKSKDERYFGHRNLRQTRKLGVKIESNSDAFSSILSDSVITFSEKRINTESDHASKEHMFLNEATALYVEGKGLPDSKLNDGELHVRDEIFQKVKQFNEKLRIDPKNVSLWLDFVDFQDRVFEEDKNFKSIPSNLKDVYQQPQSLVFKKLSILDKAIEKNPSSLDLQKKKLELNQNILDNEKIQKSWEELLDKYPSNIELWKEYIIHQKSLLSHFSFNKLVKIYQKCFQRFIVTLDEKCDNYDPKLLESKLLDVFNEYTSFLRQCGYSERAVSSYQAMIEFNLYCPSSLNLSTTSERLEKFEEYFDASMPKFGEPDSCSWAQWSVNKSSSKTTFTQDSTENEEDKIIQENLSKSQTWLKMEKVRKDSHWMAWKPNKEIGETEESCEDLDRLVLFEDISLALFRLSQSESCLRLVCMFLNFLGFSSELITSKLEDFSESPFSGRGFDYDSLAQLPKIATMDCDLHLETRWKPSSNLSSFVYRILRQSELYFSASNRTFFTLLLFEYEIFKSGSFSLTELGKNESKSLKKLGKSLLKETQNRSNLVLWDHYIRILWASSDNISETVSMAETALKMFLGTTDLSDLEKSLGIHRLAKTYCQILLNFDPLEHVRASKNHSYPSNEDKRNVIACLAALVENKSYKSVSKVEVTPALVLKLRKRFNSFLSDILDNFQTKPRLIHDILVKFSECFALFEFSAAKEQAAYDVFEKVKNELSSSSYFHLNIVRKKIHLAQINFVRNIMSIKFVPLKDLRNVLSSSLTQFPDCTDLHGIFFDLEQGCQIVGRLRKYYDTSINKSTSIVTPLFAVMTEITRLQALLKNFESQDIINSGLTDSGLVHRIRSTFERILSNPKMTSCPLLWRLYFQFEAKHGNKSKLKGIFYRALQSCPFSKIVYMDGIEVFGDEELQEVVDLMTEKELRVRMPLEEVELIMNADKGDDQSNTEDCIKDS